MPRRCLVGVPKPNNGGFFSSIQQSVLQTRIISSETFDCDPGFPTGRSSRTRLSNRRSR